MMRHSPFPSFPSRSAPGAYVSRLPPTEKVIILLNIAHCTGVRQESIVFSLRKYYNLSRLDLEDKRQRFHNSPVACYFSFGHFWRIEESWVTVVLTNRVVYKIRRLGESMIIVRLVIRNPEQPFERCLTLTLKKNDRNCSIGLR